MKKKTLIILLIIPFVIALLTFVSVIALTNNVGIDAKVVWNYRQSEGFKVNSEYKLEASLEYDHTQLLKPGSDELIWEASSEDPDLAEIEERDDGFYLITGSKTGETNITCSTVNRRSSLTMTAHIYDKGLVLINPVNQSSGNQIDPTRYYGEYDITYSDDLSTSSLKKTNAKIPLDIEVFSDSGEASYVVSSISDNISFDQTNNTISVIKEGDAHLTLALKNESYIANTYSFNVVNDGVNVYSFNDLMMCTNKSQNGEIAVLQVNLESRENALNKDNNGRYIDEYKHENTKLFGNYDFRNETFNFNDFIYSQKPKLRTKYIDQFLSSGVGIENFEYRTEIKVGVHIQKDFYGNGFTINTHELAYPVHGELNGIDPVAQKIVPDREKDYFFGPLTFVSIGDLENVPIIRAYLCDNAGFMLDGDNLTVNDVKFQNANNINNMFNLSYTGTVLEVQGLNNTIKNSIIQNGRNCVRAFSTDGLLIDNSLLQNAGEFIVKLGSNRINPTNHEKEVAVNYNGNEIKTDFDTFFNGSEAEANSANAILSEMISSNFSSTSVENVVSTLNDIQGSLDNLGGIINADDSYNYDAHVTINDTYFYNSGVYSIAFENSFNGAFIYNGMPSQLTKVFNILAGAGQNIVIPSDIGGTAYPVELTLSGDTRFYDWKNIDDIDVSALIEENISATINSLAGALGTEIPQEIIDKLKELSIDDYFPIKTIIKNLAIDSNLAYQDIDNGQTKYYINRPLAWYGGGFNGSKVINNIEQNEYYSFAEPLSIDFTREVFLKTLGGISGDDIPGTIQTVINLLSRCVVMAIGSHPFMFMTNGIIENNEKPILFDEVPSYLDLSSRFAG